MDAVEHLRRGHHESEEEVTKRLVRAWFQSSFKVSDRHSSRAVSMKRRAFLMEHVNKFLRQAGLPEWTQRTALYTTWFLPEVLHTDVDDSTRVHLRFLSTQQAFKAHLTRLIEAGKRR